MPIGAHPAYLPRSVISEIRIQNFKSIHDLALKPGRVTVLIGENGSGKSNILEGIAFAAGAAANKLDNEFLFNRGIRVTEDTWMRSAFPEEEIEDRKMKFGVRRNIQLSVKGGDGEPVFECSVSSMISTVDQSFAGWSVHAPIHKGELEEALLDEQFAQGVEQEAEALRQRIRDNASAESKSPTEALNSIDTALKLLAGHSRLNRQKKKEFGVHASTLGLADFVIFAPENTVLRTPPPEGAILPLGTRGEGLIRLLQSFTDPNLTDPGIIGRFADLNERLRLFGWFDELLAPDETATMQARLQIRDRWLAPERAVFDQRSANEGFLYLLFYFALMMSWRTPRFFSLDNLDSALNPKLCSALMRQISELATKYDKQVICTTHNPALLDGLDLHDDTQRLYTVRRDSDGHTVVHRVRAPQPQPGETPVQLSEAFIRGILGGLPDHF